MANEKSKKRNLIEISSSDESESSPSESDDDDLEETSSSSSCYDDDDDYDDDYSNDDDDEEEDDEEEEEYDDEDNDSQWTDSADEEEDESLVDDDRESIDAHVDKDDEQSIWNKVIKSIRGGGDLQELKLIECKAYLRRHGLRLSGTKEKCIERIKEHWRLKDGNGEAFYPRSSFIIDCTGDVCRGDVVLFNQKVYQTFDKMTRSGSLLGRRTVAGRVVKESYGAARQQHTFTVEVLWSRGTKRLDPLFPLLVKGRNLYKLKTFRQRWKNEKERLEVLAEKHKRGAASRSIRALRRTKAMVKTNKSSTCKGSKYRKHFHHVGPSGTRETTHKKKNCVNEHWNAVVKKKQQNPSDNSTPFQTLSSEQDGGLRGPASRRRHQNPIHFSCNNPSQAFNHFQSDVFPREHHFPYRRGSASTTRLPSSYPLPNHAPKPILECKEFSHDSSIGPGCSHSKNVYEPRKFSCLPR